MDVLSITLVVSIFVFSFVALYTGSGCYPVIYFCILFIYLYFVLHVTALCLSPFFSSGYSIVSSACRPLSSVLVVISSVYLLSQLINLSQIYELRQLINWSQIICVISLYQLVGVMHAVPYSSISSLSYCILLSFIQFRMFTYFKKIKLFIFSHIFTDF